MTEPSNPEGEARRAMASADARVRVRTSVTAPRMARPVIAPAPEDDEDSVFGATLSGASIAPAASLNHPPETTTGIRPAISSISPLSDPFVPQPTFTSAERSTDTSAGGLPPSAEDDFRPQKTRTGLTVVRASQLPTSAEGAPVPQGAAPTLNPALLPKRRVNSPPPPTPAASAPTGSAGAPIGAQAFDGMVDPAATPSPMRPVSPPAMRARGESLDPVLPPAPAGFASAPSSSGAEGFPRGSSLSSNDGPPMAPQPWGQPTGLGPDGKLLSPAEAALPSLFKPAPMPVKRKVRIAASGLAALALTVVTVVMLIADRAPPPRTGSTLFTVQQLRTISDQYVAQISTIDQPELAHALTSVTATVARPLMPMGAPPPRVVVVRSDVVDAYVLADGSVVLNTALLLELKSEAELAGVVAHTIAHHSLHLIDARLDSREDLRAGVSVAASGTTPTSESLTAAAISRQPGDDGEEAAVDAVAVEAMKIAAWDARAYRQALQRLQDDGAAKAWFSAHPFNNTRDASLERLENLRLAGSDLVQNDHGRTNAPEYQARIVEVINPPPPPPPPESVRLTPPTPPPPTNTSLAVSTKPKKAPPPPPPLPPAATSSPRDAND